MVAAAARLFPFPLLLGWLSLYHYYYCYYYYFYSTTTAAATTK